LSSPIGNPHLDLSPSFGHKISESVDLIDIPLDSHSAIKIPHKPLIDLQSSPLEFPQEGNSSLRPFLKNPTSPLSFEAIISFFKT
jgi:hypothetical protein